VVVTDISDLNLIEGCAELVDVTSALIGFHKLFVSSFVALEGRGVLEHGVVDLLLISAKDFLVKIDNLVTKAISSAAQGRTPNLRICFERCWFRLYNYYKCCQILAWSAT